MPEQKTTSYVVRWGRIFKYNDLVSPVFNFLDNQAAMDPPPAYINNPWTLDWPEFKKVWPNYQAVRDDYNKAFNELERRYVEGESIRQVLVISGVVLVVGLLAAGSVGTAYFLKTAPAREITRQDEIRLEAIRYGVDTTKAGQLGGWLPPGADPMKWIEQIFSVGRQVATDHGIKMRDVLAKGLDVTKAALWLAGAYLVYKVVEGFKK